MIDPPRDILGERQNYFVRSGYRSREAARYFEDDDEDITYQPDVYPFAAHQALIRGRDVIIDIGCGHARKLAKLAQQYHNWTFIGVDIGGNIAWCRRAHQFGTWIEADLETTKDLPIPSDLIRRAVVICSDVVEHLLNPTSLLAMITKLLTQGAAVAVLSTPARERRSGYSDPGPPDNLGHVREWASDEFQALLRDAGFTILQTEFTRWADAWDALSTQLVLVSGTVRSEIDAR